MFQSKKFRSISVAVVSVLVLAGCGKSDSGKASGEINVFLIPSPSSTSIQSFIPEFEKQTDRKSTRLNSSHSQQSRMPSSA